MNQPTMLDSRKTAPDTTTLISYVPVPGLGVLPVNSFLIDSTEPVLVDTGLGALGDAYMTRLQEAIDLRDLKWIWLTHTDPDHVGNLERVLARAPEAKVVTTFLGMGKLGLLGLNVERTWFLNPGQALDVGDRKLVAVRPPSFDAPETTGLFDSKTRTLFSADCFGALMDAPADTASAIAPERLREGLTLWTTVDAPWLHMVDETLFGRSIREIGRLGAESVLSSHLPASTDAEGLLEWLAAAKNAPSFVGPDQAAVEAMFAEEAEAVNA